MERNGMSSAQGSGLCSTSVDTKDDHVCSLLVQKSLLQFYPKFFFSMGSSLVMMQLESGQAKSKLHSKS
jgi:hypothetical protein